METRGEGEIDDGLDSKQKGISPLARIAAVACRSTATTLLFADRKHFCPLFIYVPATEWMKSEEGPDGTGWPITALSLDPVATNQCPMVSSPQCSSALHTLFPVRVPE